MNEGGWVGGLPVIEPMHAGGHRPFERRCPLVPLRRGNADSSDWLGDNGTREKGQKDTRTSGQQTQTEIGGGPRVDSCRRRWWDVARHRMESHLSGEGCGWRAAVKTSPVLTKRHTEVGRDIGVDSDQHPLIVPVGPQVHALRHSSRSTLSSPQAAVCSFTRGHNCSDSARRMTGDERRQPQPRRPRRAAHQPQWPATTTEHQRTQHTGLRPPRKPQICLSSSSAAILLAVYLPAPRYRRAPHVRTAPAPHRSIRRLRRLCRARRSTCLCVSLARGFRFFAPPSCLRPPRVRASAVRNGVTRRVSV